MMPFILYVYLLLFIKLSFSKINAIKLLTSLLLKLYKVITLHKKEYILCIILSQIILEYDLDTVWILP